MLEEWLAMKKKETSTKEKLGQTIIFVLLGIGSAALILFLYLAIHPWIKFDGFKGEATGVQLMSLDEEGCYIGPLKDFELTELLERYQ